MAGNGDQEKARLRSELEAADAERIRLRSELEQIRRSPLGPLIGPARTIRAALDRRLGRSRRGSTRGPRGESAETRRLPPRLSGSELAWLVRRKLRPRRRGIPSAPAPRREGWLTPILVDCFGRDGSTALVAMLAASPQIVVDPKYPYERRYFTYLWRWSRLPGLTEWPGALWSKDDVVSIAQERDLALLGPPPWLPRELLDSAGDGAEFGRHSFDAAWSELSARAIEAAPDGGAAPRYYAEKHANTRMLDLGELPPVRVIVLLRDPRDVHASILAFEDKEPATSFGILDARAGGDRLEGIIDRHRQRLRWIADLLDSDAAPVVRYEDLARDPGAVARALAAQLEVEIEPADPDMETLASRHGSSDGDGGSGRWRSDLDPRIAERFTDDLGPELRALGFET